ncbi:unnamed protein product [Moneuplotes crassus]|uniref:Uncharacterized protein n=1 Tax=Euplotes crassus TaxID=5936 RepID=A0AAD1UD75_EUPCR|nr:unnamed protein product [Moneuplotes crassus]
MEKAIRKKTVMQKVGVEKSEINSDVWKSYEALSDEELVERRLEELEDIFWESKNEFERYGCQKKQDFPIRVAQIVDSLLKTRRKLNYICNSLPRHMEHPYLQRAIDLKVMLENFCEKSIVKNLIFCSQLINAKLKDPNQHSSILESQNQDLQIQKEVHKINTTAISHYHHKFLGPTAAFKFSSTLSLNLKTPKPSLLLQTTTVFPYSSLTNLHILNYPCSLPIHQSLPSQIPTATISCAFSNTSPVANLPLLVKVLHRVTKEMEYSNFILPERSLKVLLSASRQVEILKFTACKMEHGPKVDLKRCLAKTSVKFLGLRGCGYASQSNWENQPEKFEGFIQAISESDLGQTLEDIDLMLSGVERPFVQKVLKERGLGGVRIIGKF